MRKPLSKHIFLPKTVNEMNQFIGSLKNSLDLMFQSFNTIDFETVPKSVKLPTENQFDEIKKKLQSLSDLYESNARMEKKERKSTLTQWVYVLEELNPVLDKCPFPLIKKNNKFWMKRSDWLSVWSFWFHKEKQLTKGVIENLPEKLPSILGLESPTITWKAFHTIIYKMVKADLDEITTEQVEKWTTWKKMLVDGKKEATKKPKKVRTKKQKPTKKMIPRNSNKSIQ